MEGEITVQEIQSKIIRLPGRPPAMLDRDLAVVYETEVKYVNRAVKRNPKRFPSDFFFQLTDEEVDILRFQYGTAIFSNMSRFNPKAFTREGCNMMSACLNTSIAIDRSVFIMRAFSAMEAQMHGFHHADSDALDRLEMTARRFDRMMDRLELFVERVLERAGVGTGEERGGEAGTAGGMSGWELDVASGRFMKIAGVSEFLGMEKTLAADVANNVTKHTSGTDMMGFLYPFCFSASGHAEAFASLSEYGGEREILTVFLSEWGTNFGERVVSSRELYEMVARVGVPLDLGAGSEHSRKVRLGKMLARLAGQEIGDCRIVDAGKRKGVRVWRLEEC